MKPVDIVIAGVQKCGTTSLHQMLAQHPCIRTHDTGQWPYFLHEPSYREDYLEFMEASLPDIAGDTRLKLVRDTSVSSSTTALSRLAELAPNAKLVLMVRNPVERAYSAYTFAKSKRYEVEASFEDGLFVHERFEDDIHKYLVRNYVPIGFYYETIKRIERFFPAGHVLIIKAEDLKQDNQTIMKRVASFVGLAPFNFASIQANRTRMSRMSFLQNLTKTDNLGRKIARELLPLKIRQRILKAISSTTTSGNQFEPMSPEARAKLVRLYSADLQKLRDEYNLDFLEGICR